MAILWQPRVIEGGRKEGGGADRNARAALLKSLKAEREMGNRIYGEAMVRGLRAHGDGRRDSCLPSALAACAWLDVSEVCSVAQGTLSPLRLVRICEELGAAVGCIEKISKADRRIAPLLYNGYAVQFRRLFENAGLEAPRQIRGEADLREMLKTYWFHVRLNGELVVEEDLLARGVKTALPTLTEWHREERRKAWKKED